MHNAGYVYNNLLPSTIMIEEESVKLIDFGHTMKYMDKQGYHSFNTKQVKFKGNIILASPNVINFGRPSRKDDL